MKVTEGSMRVPRGRSRDEWRKVEKTNGLGVRLKIVIDRCRESLASPPTPVRLSH
jgi:hypothetical protein